MAAKEKADLIAIAEQYESYAQRFPAGSQGREANLIEAAKYHGLADAAGAWPGSADATHTTPQRAA